MMKSKPSAILLRAAVIIVSLSTSSIVLVEGFSSTLFQEKVAQQVTAAAIQPGVEIELPDFNELFTRIQ